MQADDDTRRPDLEEAILALEADDEDGFLALESEITAYQKARNPVVRRFGDAARYLPVGAFRLAHVATFPPEQAEAVFRSSGTAGSARAVHPVRTLDWYHRVVRRAFTRWFGSDRRVFIGFAPAYSADSSLVAMLHHLVDVVGLSGMSTVTDDPARFRAALGAAGAENTPVMVVGAAFGLLDLADAGGVRLPEGSTVIETGGMKTHRRSVTRDALHAALAAGFGVEPGRVGSEYGMCELTSQGWAPEGGWYRLPPWVRFQVVDPEDPDRPVPDGTPGLLALTDLANLYTASHLVTEDLAVARPNSFSVVGRASGAALRGCNFLMEPTA